MTSDGFIIVFCVLEVAAAGAALVMFVATMWR
jgi:hypothetical protein